VFSVAASEFTTRGGDASMRWVGESCADAIINRISTDKKVRIVERKYIKKIIEELKLQMTGLVNEETALEIGNIIGANYFIFGSITIMGQNVALDARVANVETSEIISTSRVTGKLDDLFKLQENLAKKISQDLSFNSVIFADEDIDISKISFSVYSKLDKLKKLSEHLPIFKLDPSRRRKTADYTLGLKIADELLNEHPKLYLAHYYKGLFSMHLEDFATTDMSTKLAKQLNPNDLKTLLLRAGFFIVSEEYDKAQSLLQYITEAYSTESKAWYGLAKVYMKTNKNNKAIECLINSLSGNKYLPKAEANLRTLVSGGNIILSSNFSDMKYYNAASIFKAFWNNNNTIDKTIYEQANATTTAFPELYMAYYIKGYYLNKSHNNKLAVNNYKQCIKVCPEFPYAHRELALLYFKEKNCTEAERHAKLYLGTANYINDYDIIDKARTRCK
jgi:tetratricopeptide (TPR) repeat protein